MRYIDSVNKEIKDYFKILEPDFPEWLNEYIDTKELLSQQYISVTCGLYILICLKVIFSFQV